MAHCGCRGECTCIIKPGSDNVHVYGGGSLDDPYLIAVDDAGGGGGGAVTSVNGETGAVTLTAGEVGASPIGHDHPTSDITSGTFALARLGTGTPASGKYVDGGTGAWTTLPAGGGGGGGLPAGIGDPADYMALDGAVINAGTATTGFFGANLATTTLDGSSCVSSAINAQENVTAGYNLSPAQTTAGKEFVAVDYAWAQQDGYGGDSEIQHLKIADGASLAGNAMQVEVPRLPQSQWITLVVPVGSLTQVASVGVINDRPGQYASAGKKIKNFWKNIRWANQTEADQALQEGAVLISPTYTPGITAEVNQPVDGKTRVNLDPDAAWIDRFGGFHHIREFGLPEDGSVECSMVIAKAMGVIPYGGTLLFPPGGKYWVDYPIPVADGITVDFNGSTLFTKVWRGGNNNTQDPILDLNGAKDVRLVRPRLFGYRQTTFNGSTLDTYAGSPTNSGNTKLLDALDEAVQLRDSNDNSVWWARVLLEQLSTADKALVLAYDPTFTVGNVWIFNLSDNNHVSSDCVIEAVNTITGVVEATRSLTLTSTPTDYVLTWSPIDLEAKISLRVRKATANANTITITNARPYGYTAYDSSHDSANAISVRGTNIYIEDFFVEGAATDALDWTSASNRGLIVKGGVSKSCCRQGVSFNMGQDGVIEDIIVIGPHRSGVDVEPYDKTWQVSNLRLRNFRIVGAQNWGMTFNNWGGVKNFEVDGATIERCGSGSFLGGGRGGRVANIIADGLVRVSGQSMRGDSVTCSELQLSAGNTIFDSGSDQLTTVVGSTGGPTNTVTVASAALLSVGQRINFSQSGGTVYPDKRITAINGTDVTFDGDALTWTASLEVFNENALYESKDNVFSDVTLTGSTGPLVYGKNRVVGVRGSGTAPHPSTTAIVTESSSLGSWDMVDDVLSRQFAASFRAPRQSDPPFIYGGLGLRGQSLMGVNGLSGSWVTSTVQTGSGVSVGRTTSSAVDLGVRGLTVVVGLELYSLTNAARISTLVEVSMDNSNWYSVGTLRRISASGVYENMVVRGCERYLRTTTLITEPTGSTSVTYNVFASRSVPNRNLSGTFSGSSSSSQTVAFPSKDGPTFSNFGNTLTQSTQSGGTLTAQTYYYRIGARTRMAGPATWFATERSITLSGGNNAVEFSIEKWHNRPGWWVDGFTLLRGTSAGTYTQRYDVLPKAGVETFTYRHGSSGWRDWGGYIGPTSPTSEFPDHPQFTYPTASPKLTVSDESGFELDANYRVFTMPAYTSCTKRVDGFDVTFASALTTFDWFIVR